MERRTDLHRVALIGLLITTPWGSSPAWAQPEAPSAPLPPAPQGANNAASAAAVEKPTITTADPDHAATARDAAKTNSDGKAPAPQSASAGVRPGATNPDPSQMSPASPVTAKPSVAARFQSVLAVPGGLTADAAAERAAATSIQAQVHEQDIKAADAAVDRTMWLNAPRLTLSARYARLSPVPNISLGTSEGGSLVATPEAPGVLPAGATLIGIDTSGFSFPVPLNSYSLNAGVTIPLSDYLLSTTQAVRGAKAYRESSVIDQRAARVRAAAEARLTYYNWARSKLQTVIAQQSLDQATERYTYTQRLFAAGRAARADVLQAEAHRADAELRVQQAKTATAVAEQQLRITMHIPDGDPLEVGEDVLAPLPESDEKTSLDVLYREAVNKRLEIQALDQTAYAMRQGEQVQEAGSYPRLEAFANGIYANPNQRVFPLRQQWRGTWEVGVQASWTLTDLGTANADAADTAAKRAQITSQKRTIEDSLRLELMSAQRAMVEARVAARTAAQAERAADASYEARKLLYDNGRATSLELLQAETAQFQARLNVINAHIALRTARVQLNHALGRDTDIAH